RRVSRYLGNVIAGSFQDELPPIQTWSVRFPEHFERIAGYDLLPRLAELWEDLSPESGRVRRDFHHVRGRLAEEAFFDPLQRWHERHRMLAGFDQDYGARDGDPAGSARLYGDYLRTHRRFSVPGSDHQGDAKIHSSLAHSYEHERVWIEAFHSSGWGGTLEETFDWLLPWIGAGANLYNPHATYYSTRRGWWEWAPPSTDWRQPYWRHYPVFARAVARLCGALSWGTHSCELAVLFPSATAQSALTLDGLAAAGRLAAQVYREIVGTMAWHQTSPGALNELCRDFDVLDEDTVASAEVGDGWLAHHGERYTAVILPACAALERATAARLVEFVDAGGTLVAVGPIPQAAAGLCEDDAAVQELRRRFQSGAAAQVDTPDDLAGALAGVPAAVHADVPTLCRRDGDRLLMFVPAAFPRASRVSMPDDPDPVLAWLDTAIDFEPSGWAPERDVLVRGVSGAPQLWEPFSGRRRELRAEAAENGVRVRVPFDDGPATLLVWGEASEPAVEERTAAEDAFAAPVPIEGAWEAELEAALEDEWSDLDAPGAGIAVEALSLECLDEGGWAPAHATFGPRARWVGPARPDELPAPSDDRPCSAGWKEAVWSTSRGIRKDPIHRQTLGPSGRVPEEFVHFGRVEAGEAVHLRTVLHVDASVRTNLVVGAAAAKSAWLGGRALPLEDLGYLAHAPVELAPGATALDLRLLVQEPLELRASFAFASDLSGCLRPEWIRAAGPTRTSSVVSFSRELELGSEPREARALVGASGPCRTLVDGREIGRHAGYTAELEGVRDEFAAYDLRPHLTAGRHELRVEIHDLGITNPVALVDVAVSTETGELTLHTDRSWTAERDGASMPIEIRRAPAGLIAAATGEYVQCGDPAASHLRPRSHPLRDAVWLEPGRLGEH
ncbi:MAG: glycosyl hydrolase family 2 protein, partial [Solirubrobacteraceae bacterium]